MPGTEPPESDRDRVYVERVVKQDGSRDVVAKQDNEIGLQGVGSGDDRPDAREIDEWGTHVKV